MLVIDEAPAAAIYVIMQRVQRISDRLAGQLLLHIPELPCCLTLHNAILRVCRTHVQDTNAGYWAPKSDQEVRLTQRLINLTTCEWLQLQPTQLIRSIRILLTTLHADYRCLVTSCHTQLLPQRQS
jgi:hypothetical protein